MLVKPLADCSGHIADRGGGECRFYEPGLAETPYPLPCPGNVLSAHCPTAGAICRDAALRESCVVKMSWTESMTELG